MISSQNYSAKTVLWLVLSSGPLLALGCQAWPFGARERTSIITPAMRVATIQEIGARADGTNNAEQTDLVNQLALQIRTEPDPLVRRAIQEAVGEYRTPLARDVLLAGLHDGDSNVRRTCCLELSEQEGSQIVASLSHVLQQDKDQDVRMAAVDALSRFRSPESIAALAIALEDRDPAMQYAGVRALRDLSGQDLGNDVNAWRQYAAGETPAIQPNISVAEHLKRLSPF